LPALVDSVKAVYNLYPKSRFILSGSSQIFLLSKISESLAGRAALLELYPLTLPENPTESWEDPVRPSRLLKLLSGKNREILNGIPQTEPNHAKQRGLFLIILHLVSCWPS
jgi:predicted AAA+ superfamily ATPase